VRRLSGYGAGINVVMAREVNDTTDEYMRRAREEANVRVLLSDTSVYSTFNILRALRRNEVVAMQLDRPLGGDGARPVPFFGAPALFQSGALRLARLANAPVLPAFVARLAPRRYCIVLGTARHVPRHATPDDIDAILAAIVAEFEALVRRYPEQWFQFQPFWPAPEDMPIDARQPATHLGATTRRAASRRSSV
jgi:lauroyl/myristoyl acyltransferase